METAVFVAKVIAVVYLSFGVGLLFNKKYYRKMFSEMLDSSLFLIFGGILAIVLGALVVNIHNVWVMNWTVLITILGWIGLIKGIFLLACPKSLMPFKKMFESDTFLNILPIGMIVLGLVFGYLGFFL
jgi:hypothetical protein